MEEFIDVLKGVLVTGTLGAVVGSLSEYVQEKYIFSHLPVHNSSLLDNIIVLESSFAFNALAIYGSSMFMDNVLSQYLPVDDKYKTILYITIFAFNMTTIARFNFIKMALKGFI
jgi:hypothetical protein